MNSNRVIPDILQTLQQQVAFESAHFTPAQQSHIAHALAAATNGQVPDVVFIEERNDDIQYAIYWIKGTAFGLLNVKSVDQNYSGPPTTEGWVRPLSELSRVDLRVVVQPDQLVASEVDTRLAATINWRDGQTPAQLDGTFSGNHFARDAANALIRGVLNRVGAAIDAQGE